MRFHPSAAAAQAAGFRACERCRPDAVQYLWATGDHPVNRLPAA